MTRLLTLVALGLALIFAPTLGEAASKRIHVTAKVQQTFIGDPASPKLGDRIISDAELFDDSGTKVGAGAGVCTVVSIQEFPPDSLIQCLLSAVFDNGQIIFGGLAPFPEAGAVGHFGILGGTDAFRKARGDATLVVLPSGDVDTILDLK
jgi:Allene oxide cyclase barrel like domain